MVRGLYTSALGMTTQMNRMDVISNNIANVSTAGYKRDYVVSKPFTEELMKRLNDPADLRYTNNIGRVSQGVFVDDIYTDFSTGRFQFTDAPLDIAIVDSGFFVVNVMDDEGNTEERYTRDGAFTLSYDGTLTTNDGHSVMGQNGEIVIPNGEIRIYNNGEIYANTQLVDTIRLVDFEDNHNLRKIGDNLYRVAEEVDMQPEDLINGQVRQGYLEHSNANSVKEMVEMINIARIYDANQRMITTIDTTLARTVNDVGRK